MKQKQDIRYERLYTEMFEYAKQLHEKNKIRIRAGIIVMLLLPVVLGLIRWLTDSGKIFFLFIWVIFMFLLAAYLIGVEYLDHTIQSKLKEMTDTEEDFGGLLDDYQKLPGRIRKAAGPKAEGGDE